MTSKKFLPALTYPIIDPVLVSIGPITIHWYGVAYVAGVLLGNGLAIKLNSTIQLDVNINDWVTNVVLGIILGGRLGYVFFYDPSYYLSNPVKIMAIWEGGMAFHGGAIGAFLATIYTCKKANVSIHKGLDILAICATPGLFFGRIANFINAELVGRPTNHPFGMVFPGAGDIPRHPSQLYEAGLEGLLLFVILYWLIQRHYNEGRIFSICDWLWCDSFFY